MPTWTLTLHCDDCGAVLRFENERPPWQTELPDADLVAAAEAWVAEYRDGGDPPEARVPPYVCGPWMQLFGSPRYQLEVPEPRHYVVCPACDGRAYRESGLLRPEAPAEARERADA